MQKTCVLFESKGCGNVDIHEDDKPIGAIDTGPIRLGLELEKIKMLEINIVGGQDGFNRLNRCFGAIKKLINMSRFGFSLEMVINALARAEPDLGKEEYDILVALGILGTGDSGCYLSLPTVYIDIDSPLLKDG
ncbi:MAG: hypothetical protein WC180_03590 [Candidatus Paceibacterota bacterium]